MPSKMHVLADKLYSRDDSLFYNNQKIIWNINLIPVRRGRYTHLLLFYDFAFRDFLMGIFFARAHIQFIHLRPRRRMYGKDSFYYLFWQTFVIILLSTAALATASVFILYNM